MAVTEILKRFILISLATFITTIDAQTTSQPSQYFECSDITPCSSTSCDSDCVVLCSSSNSCESMSFHGASYGNMTVICGEGEGLQSQFQCRSTHITAGWPAGDLYVRCGNNLGSCDSSMIECPLNGFCHVSVTGYLSTNSITVDASSMWMGSLVINSAQNSTIYCPGKESKSECIINCGNSGCINTNIYSEYDTLLYITATGYQSLMFATIFCPTGNGLCSINILEGSTDALTGAVIYAQHKPVFNVFVDCDPLNTINCYQISNPPRLYCDDYSVSCRLEVKSGFDSWQCNDGNIAASMCSYPTSKPTESTLISSTFSTTIYTTMHYVITNSSQIFQDEDNVKYNGDEVLYVTTSASVLLIAVCVFAIWYFVSQQNKRMLREMEQEQINAPSAESVVEIKQEQKQQQRGECSVELTEEYEPGINPSNTDQLQGRNVVHEGEKLTDSEHESMYENIDNNPTTDTTANGENITDS